MSKKVLILTIGCSLPPWDKMHKTSCETWDSIDIEGVETIFYFGKPIKENTDKEIYFPIDEGYNNMGYKMLSALYWALQNKEFDYIARVNSSCYVDKKELIKHVQNLPETNLFAGAIVPASEETKSWIWGGLQFLISKDVVEKIINNKDKFNHNLMEDLALSALVTEIGIPFTDGKGCSIDRDGDKWRMIGYGTESYEFRSFDEFIKEGHFFYRVKQDHDRAIDEYIMRELFKKLS